MAVQARLQLKIPSDTVAIYGHTVQLEKMGVFDYTAQIAAPSVTAWALANQGMLKSIEKIEE